MTRISVSHAAALVLALAIATSPMACSNAAATDPASLGRLAARVESQSTTDSQKTLADAGWKEADFRKAIEQIMEHPDQAVVFTNTYTAEKGQS